MHKSDVLRAWSRILTGHIPSLSIEITKECPLRCPGCYAFDPAHLGGESQLRELSDFRGDELVKRTLALVDRFRPLHVSIVGGDPLVRYRELEEILPELELRCIHVQIVTSAFRVIPAEWMNYKRLNVVVSIDGLAPEHDARRKPATYERILKNIENARIYVHCTITSQIANRSEYLQRFLNFWCNRPQVAKVWFSLFTPQRGARDAEILTPQQRTRVIADLRRLRVQFPVLDMPDSLLRELENPPASPAHCIFARTTRTVSADFKTRVSPCQFGGNPDCSQCGCIASMGLAAVGHYRVIGKLTAGHLFHISDRIGRSWNSALQNLSPRSNRRATPATFTILQP